MIEELKIICLKSLNSKLEPKYGAFNLKKKNVSAHELGLVVQLSWRVAPSLDI